jgi:N-methylhydantoinase B
VYLTVRSVMQTGVPNNAGYFRPISVVTPPGSIVNPNLPAVFAARGLTGFRIIDCLLGALAQICPDRVPAACEGGNTGVSIGGWDRVRGPFIFVEFVCGTGGARPGLDGVDGHTNPGVCMCNVPCEVVEVESPVVIDRYGFVADTGGPGKYRGGLALVRDFRFVGEEAVLQVRSDRSTHLPYGLEGGRPGTPSSNVLNPEAEARVLPSKFTMMIHTGDVLHHVQPSGGGHGDPLERDPLRVLEDVLDEKLSLEFARRDYGVVIDPVSLTVDIDATDRLRRERRRAVSATASQMPDSDAR